MATGLRVEDKLEGVANFQPMEREDSVDSGGIRVVGHS